jgi:hypothetical protein
MQICFIRRKFGRRLPSKFVGGIAFCILLLYYVGLKRIYLFIFIKWWVIEPTFWHSLYYYYYMYQPHCEKYIVGLPSRMAKQWPMPWAMFGGGWRLSRLVVALVLICWWVFI